MKLQPEQLRTVLVTDCGSTTTKARLFEKTSDGWRQTASGEAPTTVEQPIEDVTVGALNAFREVEELSNRRILRNSSDGQPFVVTENDLNEGIDLYLSTSSAGGGLQMMVSGVVESMTTESAQRAALGAGAIVLDAISADDGREDHERVERIRHLKPDIVLIAGGTDGGTKTHVLESAEILLAAAPRPRFGDTLKLPVIYAGNIDAAEEIESILAPIAQFQRVPNIRPTLEHENLRPARDAIHEFFLSHVMSHAPGYGKLLKWTPVPIMPTPSAVGDMISQLSQSKGLQILAVDIGGATTDVFSSFQSGASQEEWTFNRTVSANLGMSYSIANVLIEAGISNIARWLPQSMSNNEIHDRLRNKMIRPTSIPQTLEDLHLEHAVCREALRLSLEHHRSLAVGLRGVQRRKGIADIFSQQSSSDNIVDMMGLDLVIGSGGVLSHAPDRKSAALMLLDGFALEGVTQLTVDSIFMLPHLGVFSSVHPQAAEDVLFRDCLVHLGYGIVPIYPAKFSGADLAEVRICGRNVGSIRVGEVAIVETEVGQKEILEVHPCHRSIDVGAGKGVVLEREIITGECGLFLDGRNRPIHFESSVELQAEKQRLILESLEIAH